MTAMCDRLLNELMQEPSQDVRKIAKITTHQNYNKTTYDFDYAIFELEAPVVIGERVEPVCFPDLEDVQQERKSNNWA